MSFPWLTTALLLPTVGAVVVSVLPKGGRAALPKIVALGFSLATLVVVAGVAIGFDPGGPRYQFTETHEWIRVFGAHYALGVDGIGLTLVLMTAILTPVVILASWHDGDGAAGAPARSSAGCSRSRRCRSACSPRPTCSSST